MNRKILFLTLIVFITSTVHLIAQTDTIPKLVTDRPKQTASPVIVPKGSLQIETGFIYETKSDDEFNIENIIVGPTVLRYGLFENLELRLAGSYQNRNVCIKESSHDSTFAGMGSVAVGIKIFIIEEKGLRPEMAFLADMTLRHIGEERLKPTFSYPIAKIVASHTLSNKFLFGYNLGFAYNGETADGFFVYSAVLSYNIIPKLAAFIEGYGNFDNGNLPNHLIDGGLTYLIRHNFQLDLSAGTGISDNTDKYFINLGFSWRIPR
ncbi:MAG: transporter [Bacteroidales bacterium]|nr:transporter [Bacteroidales bacterium]